MADTSGNVGGYGGTCPEGYRRDSNGNCVTYSGACPTGYVPNAYGQCVPVKNSSIGDFGMIAVGIGAMFLLGIMIFFTVKKK